MTSAASTFDQSELVVTAPSGLQSLGLAELLRHRELLFALIWRDFSVRYRQTSLGMLWALIRPTISVGVMTFVFGGLIGLKAESGVPYAVFVCIGIVFWTYFADALTNATNSVITNSTLIQKVYFPRLLLPISAALTGLVDFVIGLVIAGILLAITGTTITLQGVAIAAVMAVIVSITAMAGAITSSALVIKYRDVRHALPFALEVAKYLTPVAYPVTLLAKHKVVAAVFLWANPVAGVIDGARAGLLSQPVNWPLIGVAAVISAVWLVLAALYFKHAEQMLADLL